MEQIGSRVGLEADKARNKGEQRILHERHEGVPIHENETRWQYDRRLQGVNPWRRTIDNLSERIKPVAQAMRGLADDNTVTFACVIYAYAGSISTQKCSFPEARWNRANPITQLAANGGAGWTRNPWRGGGR